MRAAALAAVGAAVAASHADDAAGLRWHVDPGTVKIAHDRSSPFASSAKAIDLAGMRGECERAQLWIADDSTSYRNLQLHPTPLRRSSPDATAEAFGSGNWRYLQQGYVYSPCPGGAASCRRGVTPKDPGYQCMDEGAGETTPHNCSAGWKPDPLLDVPESGVPLVPAGLTQPLLLECCIPRDAKPGNYSGTFTATASAEGGGEARVELLRVPVRLEVWPITIPELSDKDAFSTMFTFNGADPPCCTGLQRWYPGSTAEDLWDKWFPFLAHYRVPGDSSYSQGRSVEELTQLAESGAKWVNLLAIGYPDPTQPGGVPVGQPARALSDLEPIIGNVSQSPLLMNRSLYTYGFDEMHPELNQSLYEIFGAVKKRWPWLRTVATLDWEEMPLDIPLDVWVDSYSDYASSPRYDVPTEKEKLRQKWLAADPGREFFWYWCVGPNLPQFMNTFVEWPAIQARLLFWLTALHGVTGMLYYQDDLWWEECGSPQTPRPCKPLARINESALTDFNPVTWDQPNLTEVGGVDGDGSFTYPGENGPLASIRLVNIADGIEDIELFKKLGVSAASLSNAADLITQLVRNATQRTEDPRLLESVRRQAAHRIIEAQRRETRPVAKVDDDAAAATASSARHPAHGTAANATAGWGKEPMVMSDIGPPNLLPPFYFHRTLEDRQGAAPSGRPSEGVDCPMCGDNWKHGWDYNEFADSCPEDLLGPPSDYPDVSIPNLGGQAHTLPYLMMDDMNCRRNESGAADAIILEDSSLRVAVLPGSGGKVWSIRDKVRDRQVIFNNPSHQPMTVGSRGAWTSGGVEWNYSPGVSGHSVFSDDDVHAALLSTERGPLLRIWEFDRWNTSVFSVDMMVVNGVFWAHPRITNPNTHDIPGYWWTCVGQRSRPDVRVVTPADMSIFPCTSWPLGGWFPGNNLNVSYRGPDLPGYPTGHPAWAQDMSFLGNVPQPHDFFMHKSGIESHWPHRPNQPYIAVVDPDGYTSVHGHQLNGTKYFTWGGVEYAMFVADFLSSSDYQNPKCDKEHYDPWCLDRGPHLGDYIEAQIGPAASQSHVFPIVSESEYEWTEFYAGFKADRQKMQALDYSVPLREVQAYLDRAPGLSAADIADMQRFLKRQASIPPKASEIVHRGKPWGGLQERLTGKKLARGAPFGVPEAGEEGFEEARPWAELVTQGTFSADSLAATPISYQVRPEWQTALRKSAESHGYTWLHRLHLGVLLVDQGMISAGERELNASMALKPNAVAARNLALLAPSPQARVARYHHAWGLWKEVSASADGKWRDSPETAARLGLALAKELSALLTSTADWAGLQAFHAELAAHCPACTTGFGEDRFLDAKASLLISKREYKAAIDVLTSHCFASYLGERTSLVNKWYHAKYMLEVERLGRNLTRIDTVRFKKRIGCYSGDDTTVFTAKSDAATGLNADWAMEWWAGAGPCNRGPPNLGNGPGAG